MTFVTLDNLNKFFSKLLNGDKKFTKISVTNLEADNLKADVSEFEDITCKSINTQNNNINAGTGKITAGSVSTKAITCTTINTQNNNINAGTGTVTCKTIVANAVNTNTNGLMSSSDKTKLDKYPTNVGVANQVLKTSSDGKSIVWASDDSIKSKIISSIPKHTKTKILNITSSVFSCFVKINCPSLFESTTLSIGCSGSKGFISQLGGSAYEDPKFTYHITGGSGNYFLSITSNVAASNVKIKVWEMSSSADVKFVAGTDSGNNLRTFKPSPYGNAGAAWEI